MGVPVFLTGTAATTLCCRQCTCILSCMFAQALGQTLVAACCSSTLVARGRPVGGAAIAEELAPGQQEPGRGPQRSGPGVEHFEQRWLQTCNLVWRPFEPAACLLPCAQPLLRAPASTPVRVCKFGVSLQNLDKPGRPAPNHAQCPDGPAARELLQRLRALTSDAALACSGCWL